MDGFKNSTKTQYMKGGSCDGYAKGGKVRGAAKIAKVMGEFKSGSLHSGSKKGPEVTNPKQAVAIALSEARKAGSKIPMKKAGGGSVEGGDVLIANMSKDELRSGAKGVRAAEQRMAKREVKLPPKAVPVASRKPLVGSATAEPPLSSPLYRNKGGVDAKRQMMLDRAAAMGLKKGGLAAMPKGKC